MITQGFYDLKGQLGQIMITQGFYDLKGQLVKSKVFNLYS